MKLSICVVTMNRAEQLKEALESCLACELPSETEFVVIDNASTDNTEEVVRDTLRGSTYYYEKMMVNLGCGGGRNYAYNKCKGEYVYVLDDDAVIAQSDFFEKAIRVLDSQSDIITLTTQIYDTMWKSNRLISFGKPFEDGIYYCKMFCGGSHFIRRSFFLKDPYLSNIYGYEEIFPSLTVWNNKKINASMPSIQVIHKPKKNKWNHNDKSNSDVLINECAVQYAIKKMMYPTGFTPVLWLAYLVRCKKYLKKIENGKKRSDEVVKETLVSYPIDCKMKYKTIWNLYKLFGKAIF